MSDNERPISSSRCIDLPSCSAHTDLGGEFSLMSDDSSDSDFIPGEGSDGFDSYPRTVRDPDSERNRLRNLGLL